MKRSYLLMYTLITVLLLLLLGCACAEESLPAQVVSLFQSAYPNYDLSRFDQCGHTAAAVLSDGKTQALCLAEERNGTWELSIANAAALRQDAAVTSLLLDTDETLFWSYNPYGDVYETYHAVRTDGQWRLSDIISSESYESGNISEFHLSYHEGRLQYSTFQCDENENIHSSHDFAPVPAAWLDALMPLSVYDDTRFPKPITAYTHSWLSDEATALAAAELFPEDTFLGGCAAREHLVFFLQKPNGDRIIASCRFDEKAGWKIICSTPLPEGTTYGLENFTSSLVLGDLLVNIGMVDEATCGVTFIYSTADGNESMFSLGKNWVSGEVPNGYGNCFGTHPWGDITIIDWNSLPHSLEEALSLLDTSDWAVVNNPNPDDRLHLRAKPERNAESFGKYYNGTPVRILEKRGAWVHVDVFGVQGWMMQKYLAFGSARHEVEAVFPSRAAKGAYSVYAEPNTEHPIVHEQHDQPGLLVLAIVGDDWYHAWFPEDDSTGYVLQSEWWEGNG